jgi:hypothetical protein
VFDFPRWQTFLETKTDALKREGIQTRFAAGSMQARKPGMILEITQNGLYGGFENWATGETDYTVMPLGSRRTQPLAYRWGLTVTDETFEATLDEFLKAFRGFAGSGNSK